MKFRVDDMTCGHCTAAIEAAIREAGGSATADLPGKLVTVEGLGTARATEVIRAAGYTPQPLD